VLKQKAGRLRTRLQLAAYKVKTNQAKTPFLWVRTPEAIREHRVPAIKYEEDVISAASSRATDEERPSVRNLNSLPIPRMLPTPYSARYTVPPREEVPTSPSPSPRSDEFEGSTPINPAQLSKTPVQLSSPCESEAGGRSSQRRQSHGDVTSSVVKTEAANRLLELIRAAAES
jgi:hypothetical protein